MEEKNHEKNYAYIDCQNLYISIQRLGWKLDIIRYRTYLKDKYHVTVAHMFIGYIPENKVVYDSLEKAGYILHFKPVLPQKNGQHKGNVDTDLVLQAMIDFYEGNFDKAILVSNDGDFYSLIQYFYRHNRLKCLMSPDRDTCSIFLKKTACERIVFMNNLQNKLEYTPKRKSTA